MIGFFYGNYLGYAGQAQKLERAFNPPLFSRELCTYGGLAPRCARKRNMWCFIDLTAASLLYFDGGASIERECADTGFKRACLG